MSTTKETLEFDLDDLIEAPKGGSLPDPCLYQYYRNLKHRIIVINDQIDASLLETAMIPLLEMDNDGRLPQ